MGELAPIGTIGRYSVLGRLAVGGMAELFLGFDQGPRGARRYVVIKRILPHVIEDAAYLDSFEQEAALSLRLQHSNICRVYEFGTDRSSPYLAMEFVHGVSMQQLLEKVGSLPIPLATRLVADVASALAHAHGLADERGQPLGIVHRDVTPDNLMIGFDGVIKLLDFGIAKSSAQQQKTQAGILKGKIAYMSPEQYKGEALDGRSDLFSLGVTFYEALSGINPFARSAEASTVGAILFENPPNIQEHRAEVPGALNQLIATLLRKNPSERTQAASTLARELDDWLMHSHTMARPADVAAFLGATFPERQSASPSLNRTPLAAEAPDPVAAAALGIEIDDVVAAAERAARRKRWLVGLVGLLVLVAAGSAVAWKIMTSSRLAG